MAKDLVSLNLHPSTLLQYVDDLFLCSPSLQLSQLHTKYLLNFLGTNGYRVSPAKAQLSLSQVKYLGFLLTPTSHYLTVDRKQHLRSLKPPTTKQEILSFLGVAGFLRTWIPNFSLLAKPLNEAAKETPTEPIDPQGPVTSAFLRIQKALLEAPALALPNLSQHFILYTTENKGVALGVLGQMKGPTFAPVAYLSKQLNTTIKGWQLCLRALAAAALMAQEALKLTLGQAITVLSPHHLKDFLTHSSVSILIPSKLQLFHVTFLENPILTLDSCPPLNPATLLPMPTQLTHSCLETLQELHYQDPLISPDPLPNPEVT